MRGFEQVDGEHFDSDWISDPVASDVTIRVILVLMLTASWYGHIVDVQSAFLLGSFAQGERLYCYVPQGWQRFYPPNVVLLLLKTIYGLKQAAGAFWRLLLKVTIQLRYSKSGADPCLYYRWHEKGLLIWTSWIDDLAPFITADPR